jgi:hypothetical protein
MDWGSIHPNRIRSGVDSQGRRLILQFAVDFEKKLGYKLDISCPKCFQNDYDKYLKSTIMPDKKKSAWKLKPMYEGVSLGFGSKVIISSANLTDELAEKFAKEHRKGLGLFSQYPKDYGSKKAEAPSREAELKALSRDELDAVYGDGSDQFRNKGEIIEAILKLESDSE